MKSNMKINIFEYLSIIIGTAIMAIGTALFLLPNQLSTGGFSGISTIIYYLVKFPVGTTMIVLNIPLLFMAFFRIGKEFIAKTIIGTFSLSFFIDILEKLDPLTNDKFLACIYGGIFIGTGTAVVLKYGGTTGGSDLLSNIIRTYNQKYRSSMLITFIDSIIILLNVIFFRKIEVGLYSAIAIYLMGKMIDIIFEGINFTKVLFIISDKYNEISKVIGEEVNRGSTGIYSKGMYSNKNKIMLLCVGSRNEIIKIKKIATQIDSKAFIVIANAREAWGKGFKYD